MPSTGRKVLLPIFIQIVNFSAFCQPLLLEKQWYCSEIFTKVASGIWQHGKKFSGNSDKNYCGPVVMGVAVIPKFTTEKSCYCPLSCSLATFPQFASPLLPQKQWYCHEIFRNTAHTIWECARNFRPIPTRIGWGLCWGPCQCPCYPPNSPMKIWRFFEFGPMPLP